ncbi:MAG: NlpC/P60 family protein [Dethiobacteria bacterium]|jgi:cell wall-associated NlpC family hydrolase
MKGIIRVPLANVYRFDTESAEMVTQVIFATVVTILEEKDCWFKIQIPIQQNYTGWVKKENVFLGKPPQRFLKKIIVHKHLAALKNIPQESSKTILKLPLNTRLRVMEKQENWFAVWIPEGRKAWINEQDQLEEKPAVFKAKSTVEKILHLARTFRGVPYLWGGLTPEGFDCSGFVYTLYALHGYYLHRDADLQYKYDGLHVDMNEICPGDLLFFHEDVVEIPTHVGIYEGGQNFINASSRRGVVSYSLAENNWRLKISGAKRILVSENKNLV